MYDPRLGQRETFEDRIEPFPGKLGPLPAPSQDPAPPLDNFVAELGDAFGIAGDAEVGVVPPEHGAQPSALIRDRVVHPLLHRQP